MSDVEEYSLHASKEYSGPEHGSQSDYRSQEQAIMSILLRETDHNAEIHVKQLFDTDFGKKVGVVSKKEYADIFSEELEWNQHHQKWDTERVGGTDMWEVDLSSLFDVAALFIARGVDVTVCDEAMQAYREECL